MDNTIVSAYYAQVSDASYDSSQGGYTFSCRTALPSFTLGIGSDKFVIPEAYMNYTPIDNTGSCKSALFPLVVCNLGGDSSNLGPDKTRLSLGNGS